MASMMHKQFHIIHKDDLMEDTHHREFGRDPLAWCPTRFPNTSPDNSLYFDMPCNTCPNEPSTHGTVRHGL